ncbi:MAG TPA: helix-turn-helix domain-containing protein [Sphingobacteriaceae bacterium]
MSPNPQLDLAYNFVQFTDKNIFLTGKAGTGKTTFLHNLKKTSLKRMAVVAPTGVAAINAGGVTIHSFFQMPFGPYVAQSLASKQDQTSWTKQRYQKFNRDKINLIRSLDLLVIDEISMVRADTLDGIDEVLRRYKEHNKPFGGVQLLMIGDLHQLSPVVKDNDWQILKDIYPNLYFFSSKALQKTDPVNIELKHIYRQSDNFFIGLLNSIRENKISQETLMQLNQRYIRGFKPSEDEGYITLTTHNRTAQEINQAKLEDIPGKVQVFTAIIANDFPEYSYPTVTELEVKTGAQVMFVKNDPSRDKLFYNGKIGTVTKLEKDTIYVKCAGDGIELAVKPAEWQNIKYELNKETREVEETVAGTFTQFPLKLAWAITIHKSQGLTFEKAIIDAGASFAHGQVYVALSRCKSFEGLVLRSPIAFDSVKTDSTIASYTRSAEENAPGDVHLSASKIAYQQSLLNDLFDFSTILNRFGQCIKAAQDNFSSLPSQLIDELEAIKTIATKKIYAVADSFRKQLAQLLSENCLPEESAVVQERVKKACDYFLLHVDEALYRAINNCSTDSDNKAVRKSMEEVFENLKKEIFIKLETLKVCKDGFNTISYLKTKANAVIDFQNLAKSNDQLKAPAIPSRIAHPVLYAELKKWRDGLAAESNVPVYHILPQKTLLQLVEILPTSHDELEVVKGIGKLKVKAYGDVLVGIISNYCRQHDVQKNPITIPLKEKKIKIDTKAVSMDMYREGKTIPEIAAARNFTVSTIEGHLTHYLGTGEIDIYSLVSKDKLEQVTAHLLKNKITSLPLNDLKYAMGDNYSYGELRAILKHLEVSQNAE